MYKQIKKLVFYSFLGFTVSLVVQSCVSQVLSPNYERLPLDSSRVEDRKQETKEKEQEIVKKIFFIRHGATDWDWRNIAEGPQDLDLNNKGRKHIVSIAELLRQEKIINPTILTSELKRCIQSAEIIQQQFKSTDITRVKDLNEIYYGDFSKEPEKKTQLSEIIAKLEEEKDDKEARHKVRQAVQEMDKPTNAEDFDKTFMPRIQKCINQIIEKSPSSAIIIVSHGRVIEEYLKDRFQSQEDIINSWSQKTNNRPPILLEIKRDGSLSSIKLLKTIISKY
jgi:broad specificity phosphatase PhoE